MDFFVQNVENENYLVVPPVTMITKAIHYLYVSRAIGTVIVPFWPSAYFWPVITRKFRDYVTGYEAFKGKWALRHGRNTNSLLGSEAFDGDDLSGNQNELYFQKKKEEEEGVVSCCTLMYIKKKKRKWKNIADPLYLLQ